MECAKSCCCCCIGCYKCLKVIFFPPKVHALNVCDDTASPDYGIGFAEVVLYMNLLMLEESRFCSPIYLYIYLSLPGYISTRRIPILKSLLQEKQNPTNRFKSSSNCILKRRRRFHSLPLHFIRRHLRGTDLFLCETTAYLREFRVSVSDLKLHFQRANISLLSFELADIFLPLLFSKPHDVLPQPDLYDEVTFTRFIVISYLFCVQPVCDVIFDFFCLVRQTFSLKLVATMFSYNVEQMLLVITEEEERTAALRYVIKKCNIANDFEVSIQYVILLGDNLY